MRVLAEIIASDVSLLVTFNQAIDGVIQSNQKARQNPKALAQLDGYKRPLVGSLSANLQRFGMEKGGKLESLQEIIAEMTRTMGPATKRSKRKIAASGATLVVDIKALRHRSKEAGFVMA
jgi:hypothetical protein